MSVLGHSPKIYLPSVLDLTGQVGQFVQNNLPVINIFFTSRVENIVDPDQLASLDLHCFQTKTALSAFRMVRVKRFVSF